MTKSPINSAQVFSGTAAVSLFQALTVASALTIYAKTGTKVNRLYTPTRMLKTASKITGFTYKRGQYLEAAEDLRAWCLALRATLPVVEG